MATFLSNSYSGRRLRLEVWQEGSLAKWTLISEGSPGNWYTIYNLHIAIAGVVVYSPGFVNWSTRAFPAGVGSISGQVDLGHSHVDRSISVFFSGTIYQNKDTNYGGYINFVKTIYTPVIHGISIGRISDKSVYAKMNFYSSAALTKIGMSAISDYDNHYLAGQEVTFTNLLPNVKYKITGECGNIAGLSTAIGPEFTTLFILPGDPSNLNIYIDKSQLIPSSKLQLEWDEARAGSTEIAGYEIKLYKNNTGIKTIKTDNNLNFYNFNGTLEEFGFIPGDTLRCSIRAYCKDIAGNYFYNENGEVKSDILKVISDKFIYVSINGNEFKKYKAYISLNGQNFIEIKKEKFKIIK